MCTVSLKIDLRITFLPCLTHIHRWKLFTFPSSRKRNRKHRQMLMWLLFHTRRRRLEHKLRVAMHNFNVAVSVVISYHSHVPRLPKRNAENTFYYWKYVRFPLKTHSTFCDNIKLINDKIQIFSSFSVFFLALVLRVDNGGTPISNEICIAFSLHFV